MFGTLAWLIWTWRNDVVFEQHVPSSPMHNIYKMTALLSQWMLLYLENRREVMPGAKEMIQNKARELQLVLGCYQGGSQWGARAVPAV